MALADRSLYEVAVELNVSRKTLERTIRGERDPRPWETRRLAELLDVPEAFLQDGLDPGRATVSGRAAMIQRLEQVRALVRELVAEQTWLEEALADQ
jgi:transcriptional regulator with XRE-family HTH domain